MAASTNEIVESKSETQTRTLAARLATQAKQGDIYLLNGPLGAGKSVFARAFIQALMGSEMNVPSPTFTLVQSYESGAGTISHFDLYRLETPEEIYEIGWEEAIATGITIVEWPERLGLLTPSKAITIDIKPTSEHLRHIHLIYPNSQVD